MLQCEVQMFQLYRDGIEDLLALGPKEKDNGNIKRKKREDNVS